MCKGFPFGVFFEDLGRVQMTIWSLLRDLAVKRSLPDWMMEKRSDPKKKRNSKPSTLNFEF